MDKCVLIVDDNDFNRELVKDILEDEDITCLLYTSPSPRDRG